MFLPGYWEQSSNGTAVTSGLVTYVRPRIEGNDMTVTVSDYTLTDSVVVNLTINGVNDSQVITQGRTHTPTVAETVPDQELNITDVDSGTSFTWSNKNRHQWNQDRFRHGLFTYSRMQIIRQ